MHYIASVLRKTIIHIMALFTLFSAVLPGQGMGELQKIPMLIGHYQHHLQEHDGDQLSFTAFLWMHYGDSSSHKTEESHDDLPLFHQCCACQFFIAEELFVFSVASNTEDPTHPEHLFDPYFHQPYNAIFQPPRFG